jgi:hypothetical protein
MKYLASKAASKGVSWKHFVAFLYQEPHQMANEVPFI